MKITDFYEAAKFIQNHPKQVSEHPAHPILTADEYEVISIGSPFDIFARPGKKRDQEYSDAFAQRRVDMFWERTLWDTMNIDVVKVNPRTSHIDDDPFFNTETRIWLETGPALWDSHANRYIDNTHDPKLDVGGKTFEEAVINLANRIKEEYGDYELES